MSGRGNSKGILHCSGNVHTLPGTISLSFSSRSESVRIALSARKDFRPRSAGRSALGPGTMGTLKVCDATVCPSIVQQAQSGISMDHDARRTPSPTPCTVRGSLRRAWLGSRPCSKSKSKRHHHVYRRSQKY